VPPLAKVPAACVIVHILFVEDDFVALAIERPDDRAVRSSVAVPPGGGERQAEDGDLQAHRAAPGVRWSRVADRCRARAPGNAFFDTRPSDPANSPARRQR